VEIQSAFDLKPAWDVLPFRSTVWSLSDSAFVAATRRL
jgi:hypothetical protein